MIPIHGLFETHLTVRDLDRSVTFYRDVLGLPLARRIPERAVAFFWVGAPGRAMLGLWGGGSAPLSLTLHLAFAVDVPHVLAAPAALRAAGVIPRGFGGEESDTPVVLAWRPAVAVYFRDPDGHSLEYLAMLPGDPRPELGRVPWPEWAARAAPQGARE